MIDIWIYIILGILITVLLIFIFNLRKKYSKRVDEYNKIKSKYQEIYDEVCREQDYIQPIIDERNRYRQLYSTQSATINSNQVITLHLEKFLFSERTLITEIFEDNFVFEKPKYSISGDFYWIEKKDSKIYIAIGDCTGFDIASLLPKIMVLSLLREEISNNYSKNENSAFLLNKLKEKYIKHYNSIRTNDLKYFDNVDLSLTIIDEKLKLLDFCGGSIPLICISNKTISEYKGSNIPIGLHYTNKKNEEFTNVVFEYNFDDKIYLYSDGYYDQFGEESGRKFLHKNFKQFLQEIHNQEMKNQKQLIENKFDQWKGKLEQVDDILIIGINLKEQRNNIH